jgi:predicted nucleic acid-binding protein
MEKIFIDTDIILDLLADRNPFSVSANKVFTLLERKEINGYTSPIVFSNLFHILRKLKSAKIARETLKKLNRILNILPVNGNIIEEALNSDFNDFEDAIQYYTAIGNGLKILITRNRKDYKDSKILILSAEEYLNIMQEFS